MTFLRHLDVYEVERGVPWTHLNYLGMAHSKTPPAVVDRVERFFHLAFSITRLATCFRKTDFFNIDSSSHRYPTIRFAVGNSYRCRYTFDRVYYSSSMVTKRPSEGLRLTEAEADSFAMELMETLQRLSLSNESNESITPDEVATSVRAMLPLFKDKLPTAKKNTPPFLVDLLVLFTAPKKEQSAFLKKYQKLLTNPPKAGEGLRDLFRWIYLNASPAEVAMLQQVVQQLKVLGARPLVMRDQLIDTLKKNVRGTPGPQQDTTRDLNLIVASSDKLRPVCRKIFELYKESTEPFSEIVKAAYSLNHKWKTECDFLLANEELVDRSMKLSKIWKAKSRGKASMLADALACKFAGYDDAPSYSMQIVEQARRSQKH